MSHQEALTKPRYSIPEAAKTVGLCKATIDRRIKAGLLKAHHDGRRTFILAEELERYVNTCAGG